jgi:hypothetical protein
MTYLTDDAFERLRNLSRLVGCSIGVIRSALSDQCTQMERPVQGNASRARRSMPHPGTLKVGRAGELIRESSRSVFLCSLSEERTIYYSLRQKNC